MVSFRKCDGPELTGFLVSRRQIAAGVLRQALLDANSMKRGVGSIETTSLRELRHEVDLIEEALRLLVTPRMPAGWCRTEHRGQRDFERDLLIVEKRESAGREVTSPPAVAPPVGSEICDPEPGRSAGCEGAADRASLLPPSIPEPAI